MVIPISCNELLEAVLCEWYALRRCILMVHDRSRFSLYRSAALALGDNATFSFSTLLSHGTLQRGHPCNADFKQVPRRSNYSPIPPNWNPRVSSTYKCSIDTWMSCSWSSRHQALPDATGGTVRRYITRRIAECQFPLALFDFHVCVFELSGEHIRSRKCFLQSLTLHCVRCDR